MAGPYNIDESLAPEDPDYYPWHEGVGVAVNDLHTRVAAVESGKAPLASPALTGNPTAPTQTAGNNSTRLATTAFVQTASGLLVPKSLVDAKGDLLVGTADNTVGRLPVGSNGQVLTADSGETSGVKWATPGSSGGGVIAAVRPDVGAWGFPVLADNGWAGFGGTAGNEYGIGIWLAPMTIDRIAIQQDSTDLEEDRYLILGLRPVDGGDIGAPVLEVTIDTSTSGVKTETVDVALDGGVYVFSWTRLGGTKAVLCQRSQVSPATLFGVAQGSSTPSTGHGPRVGVLNSGITTTLPSTVTRVSTTANQEGNRAPALSIRRSA